MKDTDSVSEAPLTDESNLLVLIIDTNPFAWAKAAATPGGLSFDQALSQILVFINAHLALKHDNRLAVIASHVGVSKFLYPIPEANAHLIEEIDSSNDSNMYQTFRAVNQHVTAGAINLLKDVDTQISTLDQCK
ncbi:11746_t:CDS:2 [Ambispora leptoticha]|uniref:General transcription and DNA repair factor IIH subunit TFB4 n=1 Tax=Ambispora leptoticha TaxID=144679 RepID=A0A9N8ZJ93_9GLOM|nr:11746_t:CDS:2 [Ambispora leptoticha]